MQQHATMSALTAYLMRKLHQQGLHPMILKGQAIAAYYPQPDLRPLGDIDIYVDPAEFAAAKSILLAELRPERGDKSDYHDVHCWMLLGGIAVELHSAAMDGRDAIPPIAANQMMNIGGEPVAVADPTWNVIFLLCHIMHHFEDFGLSMRQVCDWVMLLHREQQNIDLERLNAYIAHLHYMEIWQTWGIIAVRHLQLPQEEFPFYPPHADEKHKLKYADRVLKRILHRDPNEVIPPDPPQYKNMLIKVPYMLYRLLRKYLKLHPYFPATARREFMFPFKKIIAKNV